MAPVFFQRVSARDLVRWVVATDIFWKVKNWSSTFVKYAPRKRSKSIDVERKGRCYCLILVVLFVFTDVMNKSVKFVVNEI